MATMNISLPDQLKARAEAKARGGHYSNVSDYVRDLIRRDLARQSAAVELQALIDEGFASGPVQPFDIAGYIAEKAAGFKA